MEIKKVLDNVSEKDTCVLCPECNGNSYPLYNNVKSIHAENSYDIYRCYICGVAFTHPFGITKTYYSEDEYGYKIRKVIEKEKVYRNKFYKKIIKQYSKSRLLEIGCMFGLLLNELKNDLYVFGVELGKTPFDEMKEKGIDCFNGTIEDFNKENKIKFDTIVAMHVIEHTDNVKSFISSIKNNLCENGTIILAFPNFDQSHKLKHNWGWNLVPAHQYHFNEKYMIDLLNDFNFKVCKVYKKGGDSAFYISCLYNILNLKKRKMLKVNKFKSVNPLLAKLVILFGFYFFSKPLFNLRKDELIIIAKKC